jgi:D-arabinose 1-dehydrogenase-like Zn-dependent alcohol dehydrogenase
MEIKKVPYRRIELRPFQVRIKILATTVCGSDLNNFQRPKIVPMTPGHEFCGKIIELSSEMKKRFKVGDQVTAIPLQSCLQCEQCQIGEYRHCSQKKWYGFQIPGSFASEMIMDGRFVVKVDPQIPPKIGSLIEHLACGLRVAEEFEKKFKFSKESDILIIGDGPITMANIQFLNLFGYKKIDVLGKHPFRIKKCLELGAKQVKNISEGIFPKAYDIIFFSAPAFSQYREHLINYQNRPFTIFPQTRLEDLEIDEWEKKRKGKRETAYAYLLEDFTNVQKYILEKQINTDLISTTLPLEECHLNFESFFSKENQIKICLTSKET